MLCLILLIVSKWIRYLVLKVVPDGWMIERAIPSFIRVPLLARIRFRDTANIERNIVKAISSKFRLKRGWVFIDVGAYVGFYSVLAAGQVGRHGIVVAVEPAPENFRMLRFNVARYDNIIPVRVACWSEDGVGRLYLNPAAPSTHSLMGSGRGIRVRKYRLDTLAEVLSLPRVDAIKIDVEGGEINVLMGASRILGEVKWILVEVHSNMLGRRVEEFLREKGFTLHWIDNRHVLGLMV